VSQPTPPPPPPTPAKLGKAPPTLDEIKNLLRRAEKGDETALVSVREFFAKPELVEVLGGNLARRAEDTLVAAYCGSSHLTREAITRKMQDLRTELGGPNPSPVERLLAERAVGCWLHLSHLEVIRAGKSSMDLSLALYYEKAIDRAHRRYLSALKALVEVRRLAAPVLQVNIAKKQVNVAGSAAVS
jgi:hypothetical protein